GGVNAATTATITAIYSNANQSATVSVTPSTLQSPNLSAPSNGASGVSPTTQFGWSAVTGATSYRITVATSSAALPTDPTSSSCNCVINDTTGSNVYTPSSGVLAAGTVY